MTPYFLYARKSTESEDRQVLSIEAQIKELQDIAEKMDAKVVDVLTESKSAKEPGRPVFNEMMKRLYKGDAGGILCWKLDRLARNPIDGASIIWAIKQHGHKIITPTQSYSSEEDNTILMYIEFGMAQKYIDDLSKNVKRGIRMKLEKGGWPSLAPLGYLNDKASGQIIKDPERFDLVRKMWDLVLTGTFSVEEIIAIANNDWGFRTRKFKRVGGKPLAKSVLYKIFVNQFYTGYLQHKRGLFQGNHEPMITQEEFDRVQEILGRNDRNRPKQHYFPYTGGLIKCGECGCSITAQNTTNRYEVHYVYYRCTKKNRNIKCTQSYIELTELENQILSFLEGLAIPQSLSTWILTNVKNIDNENKLIAEDKQNALKKAVAENEKQTQELTRMRYQKLIEDGEFIREKARLVKERCRLEEKLENQNQSGKSLLSMFQNTIYFAEHAPEWFKKATPEQKRMIVEVVGSNLVLNDKNLLIEAQIPFRSLKKPELFSSPEKHRLQPQNFSSDKQKTALPAASCLMWSAQGNDVPTFFSESPAWIARLDKILKYFLDQNTSLPP